MQKQKDLIPKYSQSNQRRVDSAVLKIIACQYCFIVAGWLCTHRKVGITYLLSAGKNTYRIDLLFFNRVTQSLVAVELKMSHFQAEYARKMNLYLKLLDEKVKLPHENNSIGLILCRDRNDVEVDYILPDIKRPIGVAELKLSKILPRELSGKLPDPDLLKEKILQNINENKS